MLSFPSHCAVCRQPWFFNHVCPPARANGLAESLAAPVSPGERAGTPSQHTPGPWQPADESKAKECERLFQNGGTRVYTLWRSSGIGLTPSTMSATRVARNLGPGEAVFARRKVRGTFVWMSIVHSAAIAKATGSAA